MPLCDGCGAQVDEAHIRRRIERLELATRFRPIHIQVLLLDAAPLAAPADYFYRGAGTSQRSVASQMFFDEITKCIGRTPDHTTARRIDISGISASRFLSWRTRLNVQSNLPEQLHRRGRHGSLPPFCFASILPTSQNSSRRFHTHCSR